jgi:hypothetical protein
LDDLMRRLIISVFSLTVITFAFLSCGKGTVEIGESTYEPKIVVQAFLYPGQKVEGILITRNIAMNNTTPDPLSIFLSTADVRLIDLNTNTEYRLTFNLKKLSFEYNGNDLIVGYDKDYQLKISANFDGMSLYASSTTHTPRSGFRIDNSLSQIQPLFYREKDNSGNIKNFSIAFTPSIGTEFYAFSIVALNASDSTFIYDNAFADVKHEDVIKELDQFKYQLRWLQNINSLGNEIKYDLDWIHFWFYGNYRVVVYAGDDNYRNYLLTYKTVQEFDGNFHEPNMKFQGDGIGVFASVIADTVYLRVKK